MIERLSSAIIFYTKLKSITLSDNIFDSQSFNYFCIAIERKLFTLEYLNLSCINYIFR